MAPDAAEIQSAVLVLGMNLLCITCVLDKQCIEKALLVLHAHRLAGYLERTWLLGKATMTAC